MAADPLTRSAVDDLFNDDFSDFGDDPFADKPSVQETRDDKAVLSPRSGLKRKFGHDDKENDGLGLDEEVKIVKKRKPIAKLDEARLMSEPGIPKLRSIARYNQLCKKLRIKGKGHEFTDTARLLNHFQLWLDNLYPRAKFADALQLVEKAGHSKRMHMMRNEWINEGKPGYRRNDTGGANSEQLRDPDLFDVDATRDVTTNPSASGVDAARSTSIFGSSLDEDALFIPDANRSSHDNDHDAPGEDELDALLAIQNDISTGSEPPRRQEDRYDSEGEDDLDALLAEQDSRAPRPSGQTWSWDKLQQPAEEEDDLDALLAEQEAETTRQTPKLSTNNSEQSRKPDGYNVAHTEDDDDDDDDDLEALLAMQRTRSKPTIDLPEPSLPTPQQTSSPKATSSPNHTSPRQDQYGIITRTFSSSPVPNNPEDVDLDDLDALLASQEAKENARAKEQNAPITPRASKVREAMDNLLSSSPVPNEDSQ